MFKNTFLLTAKAILFIVVCVNFILLSSNNSFLQEKNNAIPAAQNTSQYIKLLKDKNIAFVGNQTSVILSKDNTFVHIVDSLLSLDINITKVFAPEHGFRGKADAGAHVEDSVDTKTKLPIISLYGKNKTFPAHHLQGVEVVLFDIQDVGARFYTYISTLHYIIKTCSEQNIKLIVLDRPNPNGHYIDGPVLDPKLKSFVGMHPVPVVYGMTIGEYAMMINGENWVKTNNKCDLTVIKLTNYSHNSKYNLPIKPSPNLPNSKSINLYPSICFFEGTNVSCGRGTDKPFQHFGSPFLNNYNYSFVPKVLESVKYPKHKEEVCYGLDLSDNAYLELLNLDWLISAYNNTEDKKVFFNNFFDKLSGDYKLKQQIIDGLSASQIKETWQEGIINFKKTREKYLIY
ncbi:MAG: DUF1343 domain-containing protein [Flavobacteriaceae bacterium]|nr:DUF1343 domain-containing protein [Flavobacteriaceae bacterium]